jgi:putative addiction module component (TIGR02574 family)
MTKAELLESAKALPANERIDLVMDLWDTIEPADADRMMSPALREELRRSVAEDEANPQPAEEWDDLRAKLLRGEF